MRLFSFAMTGVILLAALSNLSVMAQESSYYGKSIQSTNAATTPWTTPSGKIVSSLSEEPKGRTSEYTTTEQDEKRPPLLLVQAVEEKAPAASLQMADTNQPAIPVMNADSNSEPLPAMNVKTEILSPEAILGPRNQPGNNGNQFIDLPDGSKVQVNNREKGFSSRNTNSQGNTSLFKTNEEPQQNNNRNTNLFPQKTQEETKESPDSPHFWNPYSGVGPNHCMGKEYYPGFFPTQSCKEPSFRSVPPVEAYGNDFSGQPYCFSRLCPTLAYIIQNTQFEFGVIGFRNPINLVDQGNFGVDLGINWSTPSNIIWGLAGQAGGRFCGTSLSGKIEGYDFSKDKSQFFCTSGLFYRDPSGCWQAGAVYDTLRDTNYEKYTLGQVRVELSRKFCSDLDIGFRGAFAISDEIVNMWNFNTASQEIDTIEDKIAPVSWYTGFVRKYFRCGGEGSVFCGATEYGDTMAGGQLEVPISNSASLRNSCTYVFNNSQTGKSQTFFENTWSFSASFVFYLGGNSRESMKNPLRPLFEVADNGSFLQNYK